jgi:hypothetical protein
MFDGPWPGFIVLFYMRMNLEKGTRVLLGRRNISSMVDTNYKH